jgi:hypothetical protein
MSYFFVIENIVFVFIEVSLLNQEVLIEKIQSVIESTLRNSNEARTFQEQVCLRHNTQCFLFFSS